MLGRFGAVGGGRGVPRLGGLAMRHLVLRLEAPLMAFGGETIDNLGVIRPFPAASMMTGLFANALGWRRVDQARHQGLQDRIVFAARIGREPAGGGRLTDFQTAQLRAKDQGWTRRGKPEGRAGGANTYLAPHLRYRDYHADMCVTVVLRLRPEDSLPTLDDLGNALQEPKRPLFIGRKPCLPSAPLFGGFVDGDTTLQAMLKVPLHNPQEAEESVKLLWPTNDGAPDESVRITRLGYMLTDQRNWISGLHGGGRRVSEGTVARNQLTENETP